MKLLLICLDGVRIDMALPEVVAADPGFAAPDHDADPRFRAGAPDHTADPPDHTADPADHTAAPANGTAAPADRSAAPANGTAAPADPPDYPADPAVAPGSPLSASAPTLRRLADGGTVVPIWMTPPTDSGPGWSSLLTGTTHEQNNVWWNEFVGHHLAETPDLLTRLWAAAPRSRTYAASTWRALTAAAGPGPIIQRRPAQEAVGQHRIFEPPSAGTVEEADIAVRTDAGQVLNHEGPDAAVVYFGAVDEAGHRHGAQSAAYRAAISGADEHIRHLVKAVAERVEQLDEQWLVAVTTDHGHRAAGGHGDDEIEVRRSFLLLHTITAQEVGVLERPVPEGECLRAEQVTPLLLRMLGVMEGSVADPAARGGRRDVPDGVGPTRDLRFEW